MAHDTLASMFWHRVEQDRDRPAQQAKVNGAWHTLSWRQVGEVVRELATGLLVLGRLKDDAIGILSASRAEWVQADFAAFSAGSGRSRSTRRIRPISSSTSSTTRA
jgi:long-chain acyl-CoA synthetase